MIAEAIGAIANLVRKGDAAQKIDGGPRLSRYVIGGEVKEFPIPGPSRDHKVSSLADLIALANRFAPEPPPAPADSGKSKGLLPMPSPVSGPTVWYSPERVVLVIDDEGNRIDRTTLDLTKSEMFLVIESLRGGKWMGIKDFIRLIRNRLSGCIPDSELLDIVSDIRFENGSAVSAKITRQSESLGKELNSRVQTTVEMPDSVWVEVPVYKTPGEGHPYRVRCMVEVDASAGLLLLQPAPDEIDRVVDLAMGSIAERLHELLSPAIPSYYGSP